jgi:hypothetical protein
MSLENGSNADVGSKQNCGGSLPTRREIVITACGGRINYTGDTPWALFQGQQVYFCLPFCKTDYENDPNDSCLAFRSLDSYERQ